MCFIPFPGWCVTANMNGEVADVVDVVNILKTKMKAAAKVFVAHAQCAALDKSLERRRKFK